MSKEALAVFEEATVESVFMQCRDLARGSSEIFICLPNCPCLETFLKCSLLGFLRIVTTSFLSEVYFFHKRGVKFSLLFCIHCSFSHFCFDVPVHPGDVEMVTFGMHSSFP